MVPVKTLYDRCSSVSILQDVSRYFHSAKRKILLKVSDFPILDPNGILSPDILKQKGDIQNRHQPADGCF